MILVDNSCAVDIEGEGDEIMIQGFLAAVSACRVYAKDRDISLEQALSRMVMFIVKEGRFAATEGSISENVEVVREEDD